MHNWVHDLRICGVGAQASRSVSKMNPIYRCDRRDCAPLSGLTDQNSDPPGIQKLRARQMLDKKPFLILVDSGVDPSRN